MNWQTIKLGEVISRKKDIVEILDSSVYKRITIKMHNQGIILRDVLKGSEIGTKNQFIVHTGQLLLSKIDARNGAFGIIPEDADGGIITGNFWAYEIDKDKLNSQFFFYLTHSNTFLEFCIKSSQGATNRRYLQEDLFLNQEIKLPPLSEQASIVTRIDKVVEIIDETAKTHQISKALFHSVLTKIFTEGL